MKTIISIFFAISVLSNSARAGQIADLFSDGIFGLTWGASIKEVEAIYPNGSWSHTKPAFYTIRDGRSVLGVQRKISDQIEYTFDDDGKLLGVAVLFSADTSTQAKVSLAAERAFGQHITEKDQMIHITTPFIHTDGFRWPRDEGIEVVLTTDTTILSTTVSLSITAYGNGRSDKETLGFK